MNNNSPTIFSNTLKRDSLKPDTITEGVVIAYKGAKWSWHKTIVLLPLTKEQMTVNLCYLEDIMADIKEQAQKKKNITKWIPKGYTFYVCHMGELHKVDTRENNKTKQIECNKRTIKNAEIREFILTEMGKQNRDIVPGREMKNT